MLDQVDCILKLLVWRADDYELRWIRVFSKVIWQHFNNQVIADQKRRIPVISLAIFHLTFLRFEFECPCTLEIPSSWVISVWIIFSFRWVGLSRHLRIQCQIIVNFLFKCIPAILIKGFTVETKEYHYFLQCLILDSLRDIIQEKYKNAVHFCFFNLLLLINILHNVISWIVFELFDSIKNLLIFTFTFPCKKIYWEYRTQLVFFSPFIAFALIK